MLQDPPLVRLNYFSEAQDVAVLVAAVKTSVRLGQSQPFKQFGAEFYDKPLEACSKVRVQVQNATSTTAKLRQMHPKSSKCFFCGDIFILS